MHDVSIPTELHVGARPAIKDALGTFWSSLFSDQGLVDATLTSRVLAAAQLHIDAMEALSLRDHGESPVFHREHWHPMVIRLSERNDGSGLYVGMPGDPKVGAQPSGGVYLEGEVFEVGRNADYSKVHTYPFTAMPGCHLVRVKTCICDAISNPTRILIQDRDFSIRDGIIVIRKEQDPFEVGSYHVIDDKDDRVAVLWMCDAEFDTDNVGDFLGYPLGISASSSPESSRLLSALWDVVVHGMAPRYLNSAIAALFDVPVAESDETVERIIPRQASGVTDVITDQRVYRVASSRLSADIAEKSSLRAGDLLTDDIRIYHGLSRDELSRLVADRKIISIALSPGSVLGVDTTVVLENRESTNEGGWFKLNAGDTSDSPFWTAVHSRASVSDVDALFSRMSGGSTTVNPIMGIGYAVMANTILVVTDRPLRDTPCAGAVLRTLRKLVPTYASIVIVHDVRIEETMGAYADTVSSTKSRASFNQSTMEEAEDDVTFTFVPVAATEV